MMKRVETLEKFAKAHPEVKVEEYELPDVDEDDKRALTAQEKAANDIADDFEVQSMPTLIFTDSDGEVLARLDEATSLKGLEKLFAKAQKKAAKLAADFEADADDKDDEDEDT
jgi:thioredoxin-related protein